MSKRLTPATANTFNKVCGLKRDHVHGKAWWVILDNPFVVIAQQRNGEASTGTVKIPRADFERLARWYLTGNWSRRKVKPAR
jgi:hypothetical protein